MRRGLVCAAFGILSICFLWGCGSGGADELEAVRQKGTLVVALPEDGDGDQARAQTARLEREVIEALAAGQGVQVWYEYMEGSDAVQAVEDKRADLAAGIWVMEDGGNTGCSVTYGSRPVYLAAAPDSGVMIAAELTGLKVGVGAGLSSNVTDQLYSASGLVTVDGMDAGSVKESIESGKIAVYLCYEEEARKLLSEGGLAVRDLPGLRPEVCAFYTGKEQYRLLGEINRLLTEKLTD